MPTVGVLDDPRRRLRGAPQQTTDAVEAGDGDPHHAQAEIRCVGLGQRAHAGTPGGQRRLQRAILKSNDGTSALRARRMPVP
jgi:hypothetical protein